MDRTVFPFSLDTPAQFSAALPAKAGVVIIGGGIVGITTALFLARKKVSVVVLEKGRVAAEQSSRNWGWIRQQGRDPAEMPIMVESRRLWKELVQASGEDVGLNQTGVTYLARTNKDLEEFESFVTTSRQHGVDTHFLTGGQVSERIHGMARSYQGALTTPSDMRAEPWLAVPALARLAAREGAVILEDCAARTLDLSSGHVSGVWTEKGRIATSSVLLAGGAWSSLFLRAHQVSIPQLSVRATVLATGPLPEIHAGAATDEHIAFRRRQDGGYTLAAGGSSQLYIGRDAFRNLGAYLPALRANPLAARLWPAAPRGYPDAWSTPRKWSSEDESPFERMRVLNPSPEPTALKAIEREFKALFPQFQTVPVQKSWAGMIDSMPDFVPIIDHAPTLPGLTIATGLSGHGFGIGPGMGRVIADLLQGNAPGHDLTRFRFSRFTDGSRLQLGPAI